VDFLSNSYFYNRNLKTEGYIKLFAALTQAINGTELIVKQQSAIKPRILISKEIS